MRRFITWTLAAAVLMAAPYAHAADPKPDARRAKAEAKADAKAAGEKAKPKNAAAGPDASRDVNLPALRRGIEYLLQRFPQEYAKGPAFLKTLEGLEAAAAAGPLSAEARAAYDALRREALATANPLLDFDRILLVRRDARTLGLPQNWQGNSSLKAAAIANEIATLAWRDPDAKPATLYKPAASVFVGDVDLHFDADRMLFSSIGTKDRWQIFEIRTDGTVLRQVTPGDAPDIDSYDPLYLPDGRILYDCSSTFQGVPCVGGKDYVANLHIMSSDGGSVRRLTFDQDNDWCPTMLPDGSVLYTRWEYTDSAHYFSRVLMRMNPDGTGQAAYYGSDSYWPNSLFYARPVPGMPTRFVAIVSGHHGAARMGELVLFDVAQGRMEEHGAVQRIPGYGKKVEEVIKDRLVDASWPKFLHPIPLDKSFILVSAKPTPQSEWGLYLVDVFDNMVLLKQETGVALLEPLPLRKTPKPPAIPDRIRPDQKTATVFLQDIYAGPGLAGVPRGTVKALRVFQYEYSYRNMGGHYVVGMEGPWDVRRLIGTVPVLGDGSAVFEIPASTPVAVQPLDAEGKALQQMRSWFVGMPGEVVSCTGCHESQNASATMQASEAARRPPVAPAPWYGPKRGFSFVREVQPVLDRYCAGCHDGKKAQPNLSTPAVVKTPDRPSPFPLSYTELHPYVRRNGPEGDYHVLTPLEFHADTSELVQMLRKGHYNVRLDAEAWDRIVTWIDLNVPCHGTWHEVGTIPGDFAKRRYECRKLYSGVDEDIEAVPPAAERPAFVMPGPLPPRPAPVAVAGWPFDAGKARDLQQALGEIETKIDLGDSQSITLRRIPAGAFEMGDVRGEADEFPSSEVRIAKPFWMGATEVTLAQYRQFDAAYRNGYYDQHYKDQVRPGYLMDEPNKPVIRVSWNRAMEFCAWLSQKTGKKVTLPTEAQWEWACRAGAATPLSYGDLDTDFSPFANLGDRSLRRLAVKGVDPQPIPNPDRFMDFVPKDDRFDDGVLHLADVGRYKPNAWGLYDMHGNAAEWTRSPYRPYPYDAQAGEGDGDAKGRKAVRGGSWYERPKYARSAFRLSYPAWQRVYNVGFRVIVEE
jgi:formylglycine-generating enzyme required for sulfatase activity